MKGYVILNAVFEKANIKREQAEKASLPEGEKTIQKMFKQSA